MKIIVAPIHPSEKSDAVSHLQLALSVLGFAIANEERIAGFFGETTFSSLRRFQESFQIPITDFVDEQTAKTLNEVLRHKQLLDKEFKVSGQVFDGLGQAMTRASVHAFDVDLRGVPLIDKAVTLSETMQSAGFQWLGATVTDAVGFYQIEFDADNFIHGDKSHADVVCFLAEEDKIIERSRLAAKTDYLANAIANLDIQLAAQAEFRGLSEYQLLLNAVTPILRASDLMLRDIIGNIEQINFLAQETDADAAKIRLAAQADALLFGRTELSGTDFLYALGRENVGLSYGEISDFPEEILFTKINTAVAKNIITFQAEEAIKDFVERLLRLAAAMLIADQADMPVAVQNFNRGLDISLKDPALKSTFINVQRHLETNADPVKFWQEALPQAGFAAEQIQALQLTNQLHLLIGGHTPLVEALQVNQAITSPLQLLDLSDADWLATIKQTGLPEHSVGASFEEQSQNFIANMRNVLHAAYPTQKIAGMVRKGEIPTLNLSNDLLAFFDKASDFDFANARIEDFEPIIQAVAPQQAEQVRASLQTLQRVFQISPSPEALTGLMAQGIHSAFQVAVIPEAAFVKTYAAKLGGADVAMSVHSRANYVVSKANDTLMTTYELTHAMTPAAINVGNMQVKEAVTAAIKKHIPNYETLFGQADICECRDCRSINSPAAYLVDVLRFLSKLPVNTQAKTPLQVLSERRPDLVHLPLTCENTHTVIPYIDLVNEVLEYYVANNQLDAKAAYDTGAATAQELRATPQNRVIDAYKKLATAVYPCNLPYHQPLDTLRAFLPDSVKRADLMQKFKHSGVAVAAENLNLAQKDYAILTGENFDGSPEGTELWAFYGFADDNSFKTAIPAVKAVLQRTGISYVDLVALLKTRFLNPAQSAFDTVQDLFKDLSPAIDGQMLYAGLRDINADLLDPETDVNFNAALTLNNVSSADFIAWVKSHFDSLKTLVTLYESDSACDLAKTSLRTLEQIYDAAPTTLSDEFLSQLHRLIRLWRKTGWTIAELDTVLTALQATDLTPAVLQQLSTIKTLQEQTNLPLDKLATAWGNIETHGDKSLYQRLFLNRSVSQLDAVFAPDHLGNLLSDAAATLDGHKDAILAAFKIKQDDFELISLDSGIAGTAALTLPNLSALYRYVQFAKALKLNTADFVAIKSLFAVDPFSLLTIASQQFSAIDPQITLGFVELVATIRESGFKVKDLSYVLTGNDGNLADDKIAQALILLRSSFQKISIDYPDV
ncbi:MAG: Tc toxin subunit A, partial [Methylococcales bacterium]